jgi:hypothetical protein
MVAVRKDSNSSPSAVFIFRAPFKPIIAMKTYPLILAALLIAFACQSQPTPGMPVPRPALQPAMPPPGAPPPGAPGLNTPPGMPPAVAPAKEPVNYLIRVEWKEPKSEPKFLEVLTTEGQFNLNTIQKNSVKINNNDVPVTLKFQGTLRELSDEKGRLQLFLGRTVPYVTGTSGSGPDTRSSYQQMNVGLDSAFIVKFGKPVVIQTDENGEISVLVKRIEE